MKSPSNRRSLPDGELDQAESVGHLSGVNLRINSGACGTAAENADPETHKLIGQYISGGIACHSLIIKGLRGLR